MERLLILIHEYVICKLNSDSLGNKNKKVCYKDFRGVLEVPLLYNLLFLSTLGWAEAY